MMNVPILDVHPGTGKGTASGDFQRALDPKVAWEKGYRGIIVKFSQGVGQYRVFDLGNYWDRMRAIFTNMGGYHFLDGTASGADQARYFVSQMKVATGRTDGQGIALVVDFEDYAVPPTNDHLRDFVKELRQHVGRHPIGVYSNYNFWTGGKPSGNIADYDLDYVYDSRYPYPPVLQHPISTLRAAIDWYWEQPKWGGEKPSIWQGSGGGLVGSVVCDENFLFVPFSDLTTRKENPDPGGALPDYVEKPLTYLEKCVGGRYTVWKSGDFTGKDEPPAWAANKSAPEPTRVRGSGSFCAGMLNLACRVNGKYIFESTDLSWAGGVKWWQERLANRGVLQRSNKTDYPPGTLFLKRYIGPELVNQGHVGLLGRHGRLLQSDFFGDAYDGINEHRTLVETNQLLTKFDGGTFEFYCLPEDWMK